MSFSASLNTIGLIVVAMVVLSLIEALIPLRARGPWNRRHLSANLGLTVVTFATNLLLNIPVLIGLFWLQARGWGLFNVLDLPPLVELGGAVVILDFAWYVTHVSMHRTAGLWRFHAVHHSDLAVDVTTTIRQHPGESLIRYAFLAAFAFSAGASPAGFAVYRLWSAVHGLFEHANLKLPQWLDTAITWLFSSPNMHKVHHSRDQRLTDRNYGNIFSTWDRLFGSFTPARFGLEVDYGLDGEDAPDRQTLIGQLALPFRTRRRVVAAAGG
jgi:sterol desaturase/sphingolipid hydroxylase (fatty acid hydroxylase superfamily)